MDLINLSDGENSFRLRILGRHKPGSLPEHDLIEAEALVDSGFVTGRFLVHFFLRSLEDWSLSLLSLESGQSAEWLDSGNGPAIRIECAKSEGDDEIVTVEDTSGSLVTVIIPMALDAGWVEKQREYLDEATKAWPREVLETPSGTYEWRR